MKKNIKGIWFFGYSGSGKTFASKIIAKKIKRSIVIDGDEVRKLISKDLQYNKKDRTIQTERILGFSILSIKQKLFPIISTSFLPKKIAKLAKEKQRLLSAGRMGMSSTILTGGRGVTDEAETGRTLLGGL